VFTVRYGLIANIKQMAFLLLKVNRSFLDPHSSHILDARICRNTTSGEIWRHLNYRVTIPAFSAYGAWQRGTGGGGWIVRYGEE
jgi:hypothetical protein